MSAQGCCDAPAQRHIQRWPPGHWGEAQTEARKAAGVSGEFLDSLLQAQLSTRGETWALAQPLPEVLSLSPYEACSRAQLDGDTEICCLDRRESCM